jgi:tRNA(Ile2) C34 agmatinyltransferase TiaS
MEAMVRREGLRVHDDVADFDADETSCPACGHRFKTAGATRCPDCGIAFG